MLDPVFIDLETRSAADLKAVGGWNYAHDDSTNLLTVSWSDAPDVYHLWLPTVDEFDPEYLRPPSDQLLRLHLPDIRVYYGAEVPTELSSLVHRPWIAHNAWTFDEVVWAAKQPSVTPVEWMDTYPLALAAGLPGGLNDIGKRLWGDGKYEEGSRIAKEATRVKDRALVDPRNVPVGQLIQVGRYNVQDVKLLRWLWEELGNTLVMPEFEKRVLQMHRKVNIRGVHVDMKLTEALSTLSIETRQHAVQEIAELTNGALASLEDLRKRTKVFKWLEDNGVQLGKDPSLRKEIIQRYIEKNSTDVPENQEESLRGVNDPTETSVIHNNLPKALKVLELRMSALRITDAKLDAAAHSICSDSRVRFLFAYWAAHCVSGDTEVLTRNGWEAISTWKGGEIAQWSQDGSIRFAQASPNRFETNEPTVTLDSPYASGVFTLGHTVPTYNTVRKFRTRQAGNMLQVKQAYLPLSGTLKHEGSITAGQMRLLVAIQADGHWVLDTAQGRGLQFTFRKTRKIERIKELLKAEGVPFRIQEFPSCPGQFRVSVRWADKPKWMLPEYKHFGPWLLDSTEEARKAFIEELHHWDGSDAGKKANRYYYSSEAGNHEWVAIVAHLTGVAVLPGANGKSAIRNTSSTKVWAKHWAPSEPLKEVFCPTTETGFWVYRYKGKIGVTGNTGRWAGRRIQVHNLPRPKEGVDVWTAIRVYKHFGKLPYNAMKQLVARVPKSDQTRFLSVDDYASALIRLLFNGSTSPLAAADLANIEARVLAWLAGEDWLMKAFWADADPYMTMAERIFGKRETWDMTGVKSIKKHPYRQVGKVVELGSGYQLGMAKFALYAAANGIDLGKVGISAKECIEAYRDSHPNIAGIEAGVYQGRKYYKGGFWDQLNAAAIEAVSKNIETQVGKIRFEKIKGNLIVHLPSGRRLVYRNARAGWVTPSYAKGTDKVVMAVQYMSPRFGWNTMYGGKWAENITQAVARDFLAHGLVTVEERGMPVVLHVHDEGVAETDRLHDFMCAITELPEWAPDFPLDAEGSLLPRYSKSPLPGVKEVVYRNGRKFK